MQPPVPQGFGGGGQVNPPLPPTSPPPTKLHQEMEFVIPKLRLVIFPFPSQVAEFEPPTEHPLPTATVKDGGVPFPGIVIFQSVGRPL